MPTSTLPSRGPTSGRNCYVTPAFPGVPNAKRREKIRSGHLTPAFLGAQKRVELLCNPCILGGHQHQARGENHNWQPHLPSQGPTSGPNSYVTPAFSGVHEKGDKIRTGCLNHAFSEAQKGRNGYVTTPFSRSPTLRQGKNQNWLPHPCLRRPHAWTEVRHNPCILGGPLGGQTRGQNQNWRLHPLLLRGPKEGGIATQPLHYRGSLTPSEGRR